MPMLLAAKGLPKPPFFGSGKWQRRWTCEGEKCFLTARNYSANLVKIPGCSNYSTDYSKEPLVTLNAALLLLVISGKEM